MNRPPLLQVALVLIMLISLSVSLTPPSGVQATPASGGCWYYKANMSTPRRAMAAVELDNEIYVIGGRNGTYSNLAERYDPAGPSGGSWETLASMPTPRDLLVVAVAEPQSGDPRIYAIGGRNPLVGYDIVEMYDPDSNTWIARQPMNVARFGAVAGVVNNKIYVIGGWATTEALDTVEAYDPTTDTWTLNFDTNEEFEPIPEPLAFASAEVINDKIYVIGGRTNSIDPGNPDPADVLSTVYMFDPDNNTWSRRADIPIPRPGEISGRNRMTTAVVGGKIYMIGGANYPDRWLDTVQVYTPASNSWESMNWMPTRQGELASAAVGDTIYVFGGVRSWDGQAVDYTYAFDVDCNNNPPDLFTGVPPQPIPMPGLTNQRVDTILSWSGGDLDGDDVTYDVYFSEAISPTVNTTPGLVSAGQAGTTYIPPETLKPLTWYYWRIIAKDSNGALTSGYYTSTVPISDTFPLVDRWGFRTAEGPFIDVEKTADPDFLPESGGEVTFTVKVTNLGTEDVTLVGLDDDPYGNLDGQGTCLTGGEIPQSEVYECTFTEMISGNVGDVFTDTVTATAINDAAVEARAQASASVEIISEVPSIRVTKSAEPTSVPETGGTVDYTVLVRNVSFTPLTLSGLVDNSGDGDVDLNGQGDCSLPVEIESLGSYQCTFSMTISGNTNMEHTNTVTATATYDSNTVTDSDDATVTFTDALPEVSVTKSANPTRINEPGGIVDYTVVVTNPGQEPFTLTSLEDNRFGDLDGQGSCATTGLTLEAGEDYQCKFSRTLIGVEGEQHINRVTVKVVDDELNEVSASSADVTVVFTKGEFNRFLFLPIVIQTESSTALK